MSMNITKYLALGALAATSVMPMTASAQDWKNLGKALQNRQNKKNEWRNIAIGSGALGLIGLLRHDNTLFFGGAAGALYSSWRYEQDRKSQSKMQRTRAAYFSRPYFVRDGHRFVRHTKMVNGKKYYYFARN
jgi:hypothetical protein